MTHSFPTRRSSDLCPGDSRTCETINYVVGGEWEYQQSGYGIVAITTCTDARTVTGVVRKTLPAEVVGGLGTPGNAWTLSGNGIAKTFPIPGAIVDSESNYTVEVEGAPMQSDPNYPPPGGNTGSGGGFHDGDDDRHYIPRATGPSTKSRPTPQRT